jgi:hypothetical protein
MLLKKIHLILNNFSKIISKTLQEIIYQKKINKKNTNLLSKNLILNELNLLKV